MDALRTMVGDVGIMQLWKLMLLRARVLFLGEAPVEALCKHVYAATMLGIRQHPLAKNDARPRPVFYVNLYDSAK